MLDDKTAANVSRIVIARWGDAILPNAPKFSPNALTGAQADSQFPYDGIIAGILAQPSAEDGIPRLVMVVATPDVPARMLFPPGQDKPDIAGRIQGATILNLQYLSGRWVTVDGGYQSRRISDGTLCQISGPAAGAIGSTVQGVLAPACGTATPWGTVLLGEGDTGPWLSRLAGVGYGYADPAQAPRFGWVVDINPLDPGNIPIKRTALGRVARGGMVAILAKDGRPVIFFTEDSPTGCLYRFTAATNATDGTALDSGTLSVAKISGTGITWLALGADVPSLVGLSNAAQSAGGSPFDAPGGLALSADRHALFMACGGNPARTTPDALNPGSSAGHIVRFLVGGDVTAPDFGAEIALIAGDPAIDEGTQYPANSTAWLRKPRTLGLDAAGSLWIGTDQRGDTSLTADGLFTLTGSTFSAAYFAPKGAALGGTAFDFGTHIVFSMVRHPGATPEASYNFPATRWPTLQPNMPPQTTLIGLTPA